MYSKLTIITFSYSIIVYVYHLAIAKAIVASYMHVLVSSIQLSMHEKLTSNFNKSIGINDLTYATVAIAS